MVRKANARLERPAPYPPIAYPTPVFDKLAPEICELIFSFACLDSGYTGRSLSLVSKYISETSKPVKFQSLVLRNLSQVQALASILEKIAPHHRRVRHLCVLCNYTQLYNTTTLRHDETNDKTTSSPLHRITSTLSRLRLNLRRDISRQEIWEPAVVSGTSFSLTIEEMMRLSLVRILNSVAHSLNVLTISIQTPRNDVALHGSPSLPHLRELTITYACEYYPRVPTRILDTFQQLPALTRLNLARYECGNGPLDLVRQIQRLAPSLTHVRLPSVVAGWNRWLDMDAILSSTPTGERHRPRLPSTTKKIFIQPPLPPPTIGPARTYYEETLEECRALAMGNDQIVLEWPDPVPWKFDVNEMEWEWLERINGGDGCWRSENVMVP